MTPTEKRCLVSSTALHGTALGVLLVLAAVAASKPLDPSSFPPIEMIDTSGVRLKDGAGAGGGSPPPPDARAGPAPHPSTPVPPTPVPVPSVPPRVPEVWKDPPMRNPPKKAGVKVSDVILKSPGADTRIRPAPDSRDKKVKPRNLVQMAGVPKGPTQEELQEKRLAAMAEQRQRNRAAAQRWAQQIGGIRDALQKNLTAETEITVPGPGGGGEVWMGYGTYLKAFYERRWQRPSSLPVPVAYVGVSITVARDGTLVRFEVVERSGIRTLDDSVTEVLQRNGKLDPLPAGTLDSERVFRIKFKLEGTPP